MGFSEVSAPPTAEAQELCDGSGSYFLDTYFHGPSECPPSLGTGCAPGTHASAGTVRKADVGDRCSSAQSTSPARQRGRDKLLC